MATFFSHIIQPFALAPSSSHWGLLQRASLGGVTVGAIITIASAIFERTPLFVLGVYTVTISLLAAYAFKQIHLSAQSKPVPPLFKPTPGPFSPSSRPFVSSPAPAPSPIPPRAPAPSPQPEHSVADVVTDLLGSFDLMKKKLGVTTNRYDGQVEEARNSLIQNVPDGGWGALNKTATLFKALANDDLPDWQDSGSGSDHSPETSMFSSAVVIGSGKKDFDSGQKN